MISSLTSQYFKCFEQRNPMSYLVVNNVDINRSTSFAIRITHDSLLFSRIGLLDHINLRQDKYTGKAAIQYGNVHVGWPEELRIPLWAAFSNGSQSSWMSLAEPKAASAE